MVRFLSLLLLFSVGTAQAAYLPQAETLSLGGLTIASPLTKLKAIYTNGSGNGCINTPREGASTSGYQVPVGKTFRVLMISGNAGAATGVQLGYADNDSGSCNASLGTNPQYIASGSTTGTSPNIISFSASNVQVGASLDFTIPASKYPSISWGANTSVSLVIWGIEE